MVATVVPTSIQRYEPVGSARDLIAARDPEVLAVGPAGTGKTLALCWKMHLAAHRYPGARILMVRKTLESLKTGALSTYIKSVRPELTGVVYFGGNKVYPSEFRYPNGSVILVSGMDKADKILSAEFDMIYANEETEMSEADHLTLKSRLRNGKMPYQQLVADCNPTSPRHWLKQRCDRGDMRMITSTHRDNPAFWDREKGEWTDLGRQYVEENLATYTGIARKRLFEGIWAAAEGLVYQDFNPAIHVKTVDTTGWRTVMGGDIGSRNPTCIGVVHVRGDGYIHVSRSLYRRNMTSTDILSAFREWADEHDPDTIFLDPSAKGYIDDLQREGYNAVAADNDIIEGIQRVRGVLTSGFSIDPSCTEIIDEFGMYAYPDNPRVETDKPIKENDHGMDMLKYVILGVTEPSIDLAAYYGEVA